MNDFVSWTRTNMVSTMRQEVHSTVVCDRSLWCSPELQNWRGPGTTRPSASDKKQTPPRDKTNSSRQLLSLSTIHSFCASPGYLVFLHVVWCFISTKQLGWGDLMLPVIRDSTSNPTKLESLAKSHREVARGEHRLTITRYASAVSIFW